MARKPRFNLVGVSQHVIQRGNNREPCFYAEEDYSFYLDCVEEFSRKFNCLIHAYVLMMNHVHMLVTPQQKYAVSQMMQSVGAKYVRYINRTYKKTGTLWEGRYKASLVDTNNYLLVCMRYIELNPVRAGMTDVPDEYKWSSYRANAFGGESGLLAQHPVYIELSKDKEERLQHYRELFSDAIDYDQLHDIREILNQELVLGNSRFKEKIESMLNRRVVAGTPGRPKLKVKELQGFYYVY